MTLQNAGVIAQQAIDRWSWWRQALANPSIIGKTLLASPSDPEIGFYKTRRKGGRWEAVGIWLNDDGEMVAYRDNRPVNPVDIWTWCLSNPISHDAYVRATDGGGWADDDPTVAAQIAPPAPGHNSGDVSESEMLRDQIEAARKGADAYAKIGDDATLAKAQSLRARLNELSGEADKRREALKKPHFEAGKAIDKEWQPLVKSAKEAADGIRTAMGAYETEKLRARRVAEQARQTAEAMARKADEAGGPSAPPEPVPAPVVAAPAPIKGTYGKAATVKAKIVVTKLADAAAVFGFFNGHPKLDDLLIKLAQDATDAGQTVPGIETEERARIVS